MVEFVDTLKGEVVATTEWAKGYHSARIIFSREYYNHADERQIDRTIAHELFHLVNAEMTDVFDKYRRFDPQNERLAERFASIMMRTYKRKPV